MVVFCLRIHLLLPLDLILLNLLIVSLLLNLLKTDLKSSELGSKSHKHTTNRAAQLASTSKRWLDFGKVLYLHAIDTPEGPARDDSDHLSLLIKYWAKTFTAQEFDSQAAILYSNKFCFKFDFSNFSPTTTSSISRYLQHVHDTRPGPHGIPYSAYFSAGPVSWAILAKVSRHAQYGLSFPSGFNDCEIIFVIKGIEMVILRKL